jgi:hypothetical protein
MNYNKVADLIDTVHICYRSYEEAVNQINFHYHITSGDRSYKRKSFYDKGKVAVVEPKDKVIKKELNFENFEEDYLEKLADYWTDEKNKAIKSNMRLYYDVDSDDYK